MVHGAIKNRITSKITYYHQRGESFLKETFCGVETPINKIYFDMYPLKLALASLTGGDRSIGIVR
jgi:hypothetical protein